MVIAAVVCASPASAVSVKPGDPGDRTDIVAFHADGTWTGTPNAKQSRPALSLIKLYLGYWVLKNGTAEEKGSVLRMTRTSSDVVASQLDSAYPEAIDDVAEEFNLTATNGNGYWGQATTSPYDMAKFVTEIMDDPDAEPLLRGMANHAPNAEDGFKQDFGTDQMPGVIGSKFGWTDDAQSAFASVSFGPGWVIAAMSNGDVDEHTDDVHEWVDTSDNELVFPVDADEAHKRGLKNGIDTMVVWLGERGRTEPVPAVAPVIPDDEGGTDGGDAGEAAGGESDASDE